MQYTGMGLLGYNAESQFSGFRYRKLLIRTIDNEHGNMTISTDDMVEMGLILHSIFD